mmetsp:Transcript_42797/g.107121  ORF Transcript_42797/g.107121 Transcript_42797/m.107121 type:complete len:876 (+) Transcript_42797:142-2769(+)
MSMRVPGSGPQPGSGSLNPHTPRSGPTPRVRKTPRLSDMQTPRLSGGGRLSGAAGSGKQVPGWGIYATPKTANKANAGRTPKSTGRGTGPDSGGGKAGETFTVAVTENRHREVGLAFLSMNSPTITLSQFKDTARYSCLSTYLESYPASEIVLPDTLENGGLHTLLLKSKHDFVTFVKRSHFSDNKGRELLSHISAGGTDLDAQDAYLALASFNALVRYTQFDRKFTYATKSCRIMYKSPSAYLSLDPVTIHNMELVRNVRSGSSKESLFGVLNHCKTAMGQKLLRTTILQPLSSTTQHTTIMDRQDFVDILIRSEEAFFDISERLTGFPDLELMCATTLCTISKQDFATSIEGCQTLITKIIALKRSLDSIPPLLDALQNLAEESTLSRSFTAALSSPRITAIRTEIDKVLDDSFMGGGGGGGKTLNVQAQRCMAVRPGLDTLLDVARQTFQHVQQEVYALAQSYAEEYEMGSIKVAWSSRRGYHLSIKTDPSSLPDVFLQVYRQGNSTLCTTEDMASLSTKHSACVQEIYLMTASLLEDLVSRLRKDISPLLCVADAVALLDMLHSFANHISLCDNYVRPEFSTSGPLAIRQGHHPLAYVYCKDDEGQSFVPNNTFMGPCRFCVLTGPNMSGKSLYLRQVALITILAHTGSFVPAQYACLPPTDRVFTRVGTGDDLQTNQSTFFMEMKEMAHIIHSATASSLVIVDELGRGTSHQDGVGIAWSCAEYLIGCRAITIFATHYMELLQLPSVYPTAQNYHMSVNSDGDDLVYLYKLAKGPCELKSYGLYAAERMGFPKEVLECAKQMRQIVANTSGGLVNVPLTTDTAHLAAIYELGQKLIDLQSSTLDDDSLRNMLLDLQARFFRTPQQQPRAA